ncbi:MAG TPA: DUF1003 domain-containing protein, partial [Cyclobacteriaceae bacterium]|nr:DUF1003 domain-containing protein [Cyclobacteriaceae bacterium]
METFISDLSSKEFPAREKISAKTIRPSILHIIKSDHPDFKEESYCSLTELNVYRQKYIQDFLLREVGELTELEDTVLNALKNRESLVNKIEEPEEKLGFGQRLADRVASFGGSWTFIVLFGFFLLLWMIVNSVFLVTKPFDPYPYILLNLILSTLAALQA